MVKIAYEAMPFDCNVKDCQNLAERGRKGMCARHYRMQYRRGTTVAAISQQGEPKRWLENHVNYQGNDCLPWPFAKHSDGSAAIASGYSRQAARLMCFLAHGEKPNKNSQAAHLCGKGHHGCVNPNHLKWASPKENTNHKRGHGTMLAGEKHPNSVLTELKVRAARELYGKFSIIELADIFEVHYRTIDDAVNGKTWSWLK